MKPILDYQKIDMLDLIFDGRNKSYGAYEIRREYPSTLKKSIIGAFSIFALFIAIHVLINYLYLSRTPQEIVKEVTITLSNFRTEKPKIEKQVKIKPHKPNIPKPPSNKLTPPVIVEDNKVKEQIPTMESIKSNTGIETIFATNNTQYIPITSSSNTVEETPKPKIEALRFSDQLPAFPGGDEALMRFLHDHITYPAYAKENRIEGKVILSFVVDIEGLIKDIRVRRGIGGGCDEESIKVVKSMPRWTPGKQNGQAVNVMYNLPINFSLN